MSSILICAQCQGEVPLPAGYVERLACPHCRKDLVVLAQPAAQHSGQIPPQQFVIAPLPQSSPAFAQAPPVPASSVADYRKRMAQQGQRPSMLGQMVGIVSGGMLGMVMGYWLLNYFGGPRYNFLGVALPWVPHSQIAGPAGEGNSASAPHVPKTAMEEEVPPSRTGTRVVPEPSGTSISANVPLPVLPPAAFPKYTPDELGTALAAAHAAAGCENCQSTGFVKRLVVTGVSEVGGKKIESKIQERQPCEVCGGKPTGRINAEVYAMFCRLSDVITFVDAAAGDPQLLHRKDAVEQVFLRAAADREKQAALGRLAAHHLKNPDRAQNGVLLAGTVQETGRIGQYHWARLLLFGLPEEITVVSSSPSRIKPQDRILLAGSIVDHPRERLPGYEGTLDQVVLGGLPVPLSADSR